MGISDNDARKLQRMYQWFLKVESKVNKPPLKLPRMISSTGPGGSNDIDIRLGKPAADVDVNTTPPYTGDVNLWDHSVSPPLQTGEIIAEVHWDWMRAMHGAVSSNIAQDSECAIIKFKTAVTAKAAWVPNKDYLTNEEVSHQQISDSALYNWRSPIDRTSTSTWDATEEAAWTKVELVGGDLWRFMWWEDNQAEGIGFMAIESNFVIG